MSRASVPLCQTFRRARAALCVSVGALLLTPACTVDHRGYYLPPARGFSLPTCPVGAEKADHVTVDTDARLTTAPGEGAGTFVEYQAGGRWHIFTACDTSLTGQACNFDITAQVFGGDAATIVGESLESSDVAGDGCPDTVFLAVTTTTDHDGVFFDAPPGATVRVTVSLGGALYPNLIYWVGGGVATSEASNPLDLTPSQP